MPPTASAGGVEGVARTATTVTPNPVIPIDLLLKVAFFVEKSSVEKTIGFETERARRH